jgi:hypothetical protein
VPDELLARVACSVAGRSERSLLDGINLLFHANLRDSRFPLLLHMGGGLVSCQANVLLRQNNFAYSQKRQQKKDSQGQFTENPTPPRLVFER